MNNKIKTILFFLALIFLLHPYGGRWAWLVGVRWFYVFLLSGVISVIVTDVSIYLAHRFKVLDYPSERKLHDTTTPRMGGLAIFAAVFFSTIRNLQFSKELTALVIGSSIIYVIGLIDDIKPQRATVRLFVQICAAFIVVLGGVRITAVPHIPGELFFEYALTIIWLIGIANAMNFLDGINGLAAGMTSLSGLLFFIAAFETRQSYLSYITMALAGGCIGFLFKNLKGKVFLGDSGATYIGFLIAGIAVMGTWAHNNPIVGISTPLLILSIPIFDMIYTTVSRIRNGTVKTFREWLEYTGMDHLHHRLIHMGFTKTTALIFILLLNFTIGLGALTVKKADTIDAWIILFRTSLLFIIIVILMLVGREKT